MKAIAMFAVLAVSALLALGCGGPSEEEKANAQLAEQGRRIPLPIPPFSPDPEMSKSAFYAQMRRIMDVAATACASRSQEELARVVGLDEQAGAEEIAKVVASYQDDPTAQTWVTDACKIGLRNPY